MVAKPAGASAAGSERANWKCVWGRADRCCGRWEERERETRRSLVPVPEWTARGALRAPGLHWGRGAGRAGQGWQRAGSGLPLTCSSSPSPSFPPPSPSLPGSPVLTCPAVTPFPGQNQRLGPEGVKGRKEKRRGLRDAGCGDPLAAFGHLLPASRPGRSWAPGPRGSDLGTDRPGKGLSGHVRGERPRGHRPTGCIPVGNGRRARREQGVSGMCGRHS